MRLSGHLVRGLRQAGAQLSRAPALLRLDRIYLRNAVPRPVLSRYPWSHLSDHAPLVAQVTYEAPWCDGNRVELLINGEQYYPACSRPWPRREESFWKPSSSTTTRSASNCARC
jgi:hypothetical protein